jgi:hypothetical protein
MAEGAFTYFRAVTVDFDGTLVDGLVALYTLAALAGGIRVILVSGRILSELRAAFPQVEDHVDAVEKGVLVVTQVGVRQLAARGPGGERVAGQAEFWNPTGTAWRYGVGQSVVVAGGECGVGDLAEAPVWPGRTRRWLPVRCGVLSAVGAGMDPWALPG